MPFGAQHQHAQRFQEEAPDHAERVRFAQQNHVAAAHHDGGELQQRDQVDQPVGGAETLVRLAEPLDQHAVFRHPVHHAVGADHRRVDRAGENQRAHHHHKNMEQKPQQLRSSQMHRETAQQVVHVLRTHRIRDDHSGEQRDHTGADQRVDADQSARAPQILQLGVGDLAVDLRQRFEPAHREQRVAERNHEGDERRTPAASCRGTIPALHR